MYLDFHLICPDTEYLVSVLEAAAGCCSVPGSVDCCPAISSQWLWSSADDPSVSLSVFTITEKAPTRAFSWLKVPTFKTLLRHYAKRALTPRSLNVKLGR